MADGSWTADEALEQLYAAHWRQLVRLSVLLVRDVGTAEEVVQDAFIAVHRRWGRLRDPDKALAYLRQAVVNQSRSALRHRMVVARYAARGPDPEPEPDHPAEVVDRRARGARGDAGAPPAAARGAGAALLPGPVRGRDRRHARHQPGCGEEPCLARRRGAARAR